MASFLTYLFVDVSRNVGRELAFQLAFSSPNKIIATIRKPAPDLDHLASVAILTVDQCSPLGLLFLQHHKSFQNGHLRDQSCYQSKREGVRCKNRIVPGVILICSLPLTSD